MPIESTHALASPEPVAPAQQRNRAQGELGRDDFMQLLVAQLGNQDPNNPMDSREMIAQLSQLTSVEQLVQIEHRLEALEIGTAAIANGQAPALVGRTVTADAANLTLPDLGSATTSFELQGRADDVEVEILNSAGNVVSTLQLGETFPGVRTVEWNGTTDAGERAPAGRYSIRVNATTEGGGQVAASTEISGRVSGISFEHGYPELMVGQARILLSDVTSIEE